MNPQDLERRIAALEQELQNLKRVSGIGVEFRNALTYNGFPRTKLVPVAQDPSYTYLPQPTKTVTQGMGTTEVMDIPTYWARLDSETTGATKWIPVYVKAEL